MSSGFPDAMWQLSKTGVRSVIILGVFENVINLRLKILRNKTYFPGSMGGTNLELLIDILFARLQVKEAILAMELGCSGENDL